jgi:hypothetical protein
LGPVQQRGDLGPLEGDRRTLGVVLVIGRDIGRGRENALQVAPQLLGLRGGGGPVGE